MCARRPAEPSAPVPAVCSWVTGLGVLALSQSWDPVTAQSPSALRGFTSVSVHGLAAERLRRPSLA